MTSGLGDGGSRPREHRGVDAPLVTAVLCTYNRSDRVERAVGAILAQEGCPFELVVVDDGSLDDTPDVLARIDDPRLRVVRRPNGGLSRARNSGLAAARGEWVTFIDDDDLAEPGWLATFAEQIGDPAVGVVCCGATFVAPDGRHLFEHHPRTLGGPYGEGVGSWLAGTFAVRVDLLRRAGGYLDGLGNRHQSELFIRLLSVARAEGLGMTSVDLPMVRIEAQPATSRRDVNPRRLYDTTRWILARHVDAFAGQNESIAALEGVAGINAARVGDWRAARRRLFRSLRTAPRSRAAWGRLALACVPALGARVWHRHGDWAKPGHLRPGVRDQSIGGAGDDEPRELFLTWGYEENPPAREAGSRDPSAEPVPGPLGRRADRLADRHDWRPVVRAGDDGSLPGAPSVARPGLVVVDAPERVDDPVGLLRQVARAAGGAAVLVSAVDRGVVDPGRPLGPPADPARRREWSHDQFELLLHSTGFDVVRTWRVPAGLAPRQPGGRGLTGRVRALLRRRRAGMVFLVTARSD